MGRNRVTFARPSFSVTSFRAPLSVAPLLVSPPLTVQDSCFEIKVSIQVFNSFLSFAVRHEFFLKNILYLSKKLQETLLFVHRFQVIYYFAYLLMRYTFLFQAAQYFCKLNLIKKLVNLGGRF